MCESIFFSHFLVIVQRALSAKDIYHGRGGTIFAGYLKILPVFLMVIPGLISRALYAEQVAKAPNLAYVLLIKNILPVGARGLMVAAMLAALMSTLASVFHSSSTLFTMDIYRPLRSKVKEYLKHGRAQGHIVMSEANIERELQEKVEEEVAEKSHEVQPMNTQHVEELIIEFNSGNNQQQKEVTIQQEPEEEEESIQTSQLEATNSNNDTIEPKEEEEEETATGTEYVLIGRLAGIIITVLGIAWIPLVPLLSQQLYIYTHKVMSYFAPSIAVVFLLGVLIPRVNATGAIVTLISGLVIGMSRLILEIVFSSTAELFLPLQLFVKMNFLHFSACFALFSIVVHVSVSLLTARPSEEQVRNLTVMIWLRRKEKNEVAIEQEVKRTVNQQEVEAKIGEEVADEQQTKNTTIEKQDKALIGDKIKTGLNLGASCVLGVTLLTLYFIFR